MTKWTIGDAELRRWAADVVAKYSADEVARFIRSLTYAANVPTFKAA